MEKKAATLAATMEVLDSAVPAYEMAQLNPLPPHEEEWLHREVERMCCEPQLPNGSHRERNWAEKMRKISRERNFDERVTQKAWIAAQKWSEVNGWYYTLSPLTPRENKKDHEWHRQGLQAARENSMWDMVWFHEMCLKGLPERVADFKMECLFLLKRTDGNTDRMVRLINVVGEVTKPIPLPAEEYRSPEKYRGWCLNQGNFHWAGNQKQLEALHLDIGRATAWRMVNQVCTYGWLPVAGSRGPGSVQLDGLWIFKDSAWANGEPLPADEHGVYWYKDEGYKMSDTGRENKFHQKAPRMYPDFDLRKANLDLDPKTKPLTTGELEDSSEVALIRRFYRETCDRMFRTVGSYDAWLLVGSVLSYPAAPEIFEERNEFTGAWIHGARESGKSTFTGLLMEFGGMHVGRQGINLRGTNSSAVGLAQALDQYSNLPVWVDEFRFAEVGADKISVLHQTYNRGGQTKFNPSMIQRECRTNFLVSGESTTDDAALRGRYMHIQMSAKGREMINGVTVPHDKWFSEHSRYFFVFFRYLLQHRAEFVELTMKLLATWRETPGISERTKLAYGIPYAAFLAMAHLLESHTASELKALRDHTIRAATDAAADVISETNLNVVWEHVITAFIAKEIAKSCFRLKKKHGPHPPGAPNQQGWTSYELYVDVNSMLAALNQYLVRQRIQMTLTRKDLRDQLSKEPYWIPTNSTMRFGSGSESVKCWAFDVDQHPLGYQKMSDEVVRHFLENPSESDPRKGPLFAIIHAIEEEERVRA